MTDVFDRIRAANPVPDPDRYHESVTGEGRQLLSSIRYRRNHMTVDEITRLETPPAPPSPSRPRGWKVAVTAAAAVVALIAGFVALGGGGDRVVAITDLGIAERFVDSLETGAVADYESLVASDAVAEDGLFFGQPSTQWAYVSRFQAATGGSYTADCRETPASPSVDVVCTVGESNVFREAAGVTPNQYDWSFGIEDGVITLLNFGGDLIFPVFDQIIAYDGWLQTNYSDEYAGLMGIPQFLLDIAGAEAEELLPMPLVDTDAQIARHSELTAEWFASLS